MSIRMKLAFGCYFVSGVLLVGFGFVYLFRAEFMPYHAVAVGMPWAEVPPQFQVLILALMKGVGGTCLALALALFVILLVPFRQGARWALWTTPLLVLAQSAGAVYSMSHVALNTSASPPFWAPLVAVVLGVVAFALSVSGNKQRTGV